MINENPEKIISIDPGRRKCGLVVIGRDLEILEKKVITTAELCPVLGEYIEKYRPDRVLMGSGTHARKLVKEVKGVTGKIPVTLVDERNSTEKGKEKYLADHPARGLLKLVPRGMRLPPEPYDDYAALVLVEQYLAENQTEARKR